MKTKLLLITALLLATVFSFAQSLSLTYEGEPLEPNEEIFVEGSSAMEIVAEIQVTNNSADSMAVKVRKIENFLIDSTVCAFCWGQCFPPGVFESPNSINIPVDSTSNMFSAHYNPNGYAGQSTVSFVFFDMDNPNDSVMVVILFNGLYTDVNENIASNFNISEPYPNPANNNVSFNYNYDGIRDAQLNIYTIVGSLVKEIKLTNNAGSLKINTSELEEGFYFYKLTSENREIESGKFIIKH